MKKIFRTALMWLVCLDLSAQTAGTLKQPAFGDFEREILLQAEGYLRSGYRYTAVVNTLILAGGTMFLADQVDGELNTLAAVGFEIGFGGVEMSKFSAVPMVKARRAFSRLREAWPDTGSYAAVINKIRTAETLSKISVACTFLGEGFLILGALQNDDWRTVFFIAGIASSAIALGTQIGTTIAAQRARIELGKSAGTLGLHAGADGVGAVYRLP